MNDEVVDVILNKDYLSKKHMITIKQYILSNQDVYCCFCGEKLCRKNISVEHIIPKSKSKQPNRLDNLTFSCIRCNMKRDVCDFFQYRSYRLSKGDPPFGCREYHETVRARKIDKKLRKRIFDGFRSGKTYEEVAELNKVRVKTVKIILTKGEEP